jgi:hypothetical protein
MSPAIRHSLGSESLGNELRFTRVVLCTALVRLRPRLVHKSVRNLGALVVSLTSLHELASVISVGYRIKHGVKRAMAGRGDPNVYLQGFEI